MHVERAFIGRGTDKRRRERSAGELLKIDFGVDKRTEKSALHRRRKKNKNTINYPNSLLKRFNPLVINDGALLKRYC